jgi:polyphosphate kinase 2 (PPK2 family)
MTDLPSQWSHEPGASLRFRAGDTIADIDTDASPGFTGSRSDAVEIQAERNQRLAGLQEMLYADGKGGSNRSLLLVLQGMDTAGKGSIVKRC